VSTTATKPLRIGEVAELTGTTPRTIRYWEEIGLLPGANDRAQGQHRIYGEADVERVREIIRLRDLLGLSLDQLAVLLDAETARAAVRRELEHAEDPARIKKLLEEALGHIGTQLELVRMRREALGQLEEELVAKRRRIHRRLAELPEK
jgi:MerR family transcriptional regulator, repressor of the yfmOP operon